jgi:hypothetical protein
MVTSVLHLLLRDRVHNVLGGLLYEFGRG